MRWSTRKSKHKCLIETPLPCLGICCGQLYSEEQSGFDPVFWTAFGQRVLSQDHLDRYKRLELVSLACEF